MKKIVLALLIPLLAGFARETILESSYHYRREDYHRFTHTLSQLSGWGEWIEIEDGSTWQINPWHMSKSGKWRTFDPLVITQNTSWVSSYPYRIVNLVTDEAVEANLCLGPFHDNRHTCFIVAIDYVEQYLALSNQTQWYFSAWDAACLQEWRIGDAVIIGENANMFSLQKSILINVNLNDYLKADHL